jgi:hypothetical protein
MNFFKYSGAVLVIAFLAGSFPSRADETYVVGNQTPDKDYISFIDNGRPTIPVLILSPQGNPLGVETQILQSAAEIHRVTVVIPAGGRPSPTLIGPGLQSAGATILGGLPPASGVAPRISSQVSLPSSPSTSSLPPDPNFSYLTLLVGTLPFVKDIQAALAQAANLKALAAIVGGALGLAYLTLRSDLLQDAFQSAWKWMIQDAREGNLPLVMNYQTVLSNSISIYDTFSPTAPEHFTPANLAALNQFLNIMPPSLLQNLKAIVNGPVNEMTGDGSFTTGSEIALEGGAEINAANLPHEIGLTVFESNLFQDGPLGQQWGALWSQSTDPVWDTAYPFSNFPPRPMPANQAIPFGDTNEAEDFASVFNDWVNESATPRLNSNESSSIMEQAVYAASQGHTILLQKTLLVASLFTDPVTHQLSLYNYQNYQAGNTIERTLSQVQSSPTSLTLGAYTFTIQNGLLTGVSSPASQVTLASGQIQNIPALNYTFPTPVPIPAFAVDIWGLS